MCRTARSSRRSCSLPSDPKPANRGGTHCKHDHDLSDAWISTDGRRHCRECARLRNRQYRENRQRTELERSRERTAYRLAKGGANEKPCLDCGKPVIGYSTFGNRRCSDCRYQRYHAVRPCPRCGKDFAPGWGRLKYCSKACAFSKMSEDRDGDGNPAFRTGKRVGITIPGWRLQAKGESCCRRCGDRDRVQLHHAIPRGKWKDGRADLRNGIPLCFACHTGWHHHRVTLCRSIFKQDEWSFISSAVLTGQSTEAWLDDRYPSC